MQRAKQVDGLFLSSGIIKGSVTNFAKYTLDAPEGVTISEIDSKGGDFTFENNKLKIVWVSVPADPEFTLAKMPSFTSVNSASDSLS